MKVHFPITSGVFRRVVGHVKAVDGVSLDIGAGRTLALVGESGCGKTTVGKAILRLIEPSGGSARLGDTDIGSLSAAALRAARAGMQMIFQDPFGSLNPRLRVVEIIEEGMNALGISGSAAERRARVAQMLEQVGLRAGTGRTLPARILRRTAPAHRDRARAGGVAAPDRLRRAHLRARRLGAGADPQPAAGAAGAPRRSPTCSSRTTSRWWNTSRTRSR